MNLLWFNLATDADDPALGFATRWIQAVARRVDSIQVITMRAGRFEAPPNVRLFSLGKERGYSEARRVVEFYHHLGTALRRERFDACFSHMSPVFTVLGAPLLRRRAIPVTTWYTHPKLTRTLCLAHHLSDRVTTGLPSSYPYRRDKLVVMGHGIDTELFVPEPAATRQHPPLILCVGRLSPAKDHPTLLLAASLLRQQRAGPFQVAIVGGAPGEPERPYVEQLRRQVTALGLEDTVSFEPPAPVTQMPAWYRRAAVHVNLTGQGWGDKVAWEAMSCATPSVVANPEFAETLGRYRDPLLFRCGDAKDLARRLAWVLHRTESERAAMGDYLCAQVRQQHSLTGLADRLVALLSHRLSQ